MSLYVSFCKYRRITSGRSSMKNICWKDKEREGSKRIKDNKLQEEKDDRDRTSICEDGGD